MLINCESIPLTVVVLLVALSMFVAATAVCCTRFKRSTTSNAFGVFITF